MDDKKNLKSESLDKVAGGESLGSSGREMFYCRVCGYVYDPVDHDNVAFATLDDYEWKCPICNHPKYEFSKM